MAKKSAKGSPLPDELKSGLEKPIKNIFVIMPFTRTPTRGESELAEFFEEQLKEKIENASRLKYRYQVRRSGEAFRITEQLIRDLFRADVVICDLSGEYSNPNVMYELGIRLACSRRPVILIREKHSNNQSIFDVQGLHIHDYNPLALSSLGRYLLGKITAFESGAEIFESPVLDVLEDEANFERVGRGRVRVAVEVLEVGLVSQIRALSRELNRYLVSNQVGMAVPLDPMHLASYLVEKRKSLDSVDWSEFKFALGPHPAVSYYLSVQYLRGIVDDVTEVAFSGHMLRYYEAYFNNVLWWFGVDFDRITGFVQHTLLMAHACLALRRMLSSDESEQAHGQAKDWVQEITRMMNWEI